MPSATDTVQGVAVYIESHKDGSNMSGTTQMFIVPDGYNEDAEEVPGLILRRTITTQVQNEEWKFTNLPQSLPAPAKPGDITDIDKYVEERMQFGETLFDYIIDNGWSLVGVPLMLEITRRDLLDIAKQKTPKALIVRMDKSRTAHGYPAKYI